MSPEQARALYRNAMNLYGEAVTIEAAPVANSPTPPASGPSRARIMDYTPEEIAGGVSAAMRKAIVLHEDLAGTPFPNGLVKGARILWNGRRLVVDYVDTATQRIAGVPVAYTCRVGGS